MTTLRHAAENLPRTARTARRLRVALALGAAAIAGVAGVAGATFAAVPGAGASTGRAAAQAVAAACHPGKISLSRASGGNGTLVTVKGTGWWVPTPGDGLGGVTVSFTKLVGQQSPGAAVVNSHGDFAVTLKVTKADARGSNRIEAIEESGCTSPISYPKAFAAFTVS